MVEGHDSWVQSVPFSPDGQRLASPSHDNTGKIKDANSGQCLQTLEGRDSAVQSDAFSADDSMIYNYRLGVDQARIICNSQNIYGCRRNTAQAVRPSKGG